MDCQAPLFMGFPKQEYWSGWLFPSPGDLPEPGIKLVSPALEAGSLLTEPSTVLGTRGLALIRTDRVSATADLLLYSYLLSNRRPAVWG